ncbi:hypothetical protein [Desulfovibrio sp. DV]|uniref:hypothetical protein n=1 Tax=Desulfovibrio sp. DV TaxID=1844708 RepID=UPI00094BB93C|nr:hypothetical protein [Desulfovibrio sp. DV]
MSGNEAGETTEVALLRRIDGKMDTVVDRLDTVERRAMVAGACSGSLAGGVAAIAIGYIRAKMGW